MTHAPYIIQVREGAHTPWRDFLRASDQAQAIADAKELADNTRHTDPSEYRVIERRGKGHTELFVSVRVPACGNSEVERALRDRKTLDPDEAMASSSARSVCLSGDVRTRYAHAKRVLRDAELTWHRHPTKFNAQVVRLAHVMCADIMSEILGEVDED